MFFIVMCITIKLLMEFLFGADHVDDSGVLADGN